MKIILLFLALTQKPSPPKTDHALDKMIKRFAEAARKKS